MTPTAAHIMRALPYRLNSTDTANKAINIIIEQGFRHLPVVEDRKVVGMISVFDLIRTSMDEAELTPVAELMSQPVKTLKDFDPLEKAVQLFINEGLHAIPVVDKGGHLVGIISTVDMIRYLSEELKLKRDEVSTA